MAITETENIKQIPYTDWALALMTQGIIVRLSVSRWRGECKLKKDDLGIHSVDKDVNEFMDKYIRLGTQKLLPPPVINELNLIEMRARNNLNQYSFNTVWGKFVPNKVFDIWKKENEIIKNDFIQASLVIGRRYNEIVIEVKEEYKKMAKDVWARLYPENANNPTPSFVENFASRIIKNIPLREDIISSFKYEAAYFIIPMPSVIEEDILKANEIRKQREMQQLNEQLEKESRQIIAEEYIQRKKELIDNFLQSTVVHMRNHVAELCDAILKSIGKRRSLNKVSISHINKINDIIKKIRLLNFYNDKEITNLLNDLETETNKFKGERNDDIVVNKLKEIVDVGNKEIEFNDFNPAIDYLEV